MGRSKNEIEDTSKSGRRAKAGDPGQWIQEYIQGSKSAEEALFKINEILYAGEYESTRKHVRAPVAVDVKFTVGSNEYKGVSYTLSQKGVFIKFADPPPVKTEVLVELFLPDEEKTVKTKGKVVQSTPLGEASEKGSLSGMAVVFNRIKAEDRKRIDRVVKSRAREMKISGR